MKIGSNLPWGEFVFYCPECDGLYVLNMEHSFLFKNELGRFIKVFERGNELKMHDFYLIGEL